jgi:hypothetical protein
LLPKKGEKMANRKIFRGMLAAALAFGMILVEGCHTLRGVSHAGRLNEGL